MFIEELAKKQLKVADINKLRDRYEGIDFLYNLKKRFYTLFALENMTGLKIVQKEKNPDSFLKDIIVFKKKKFQIVCFEFGEIPTFEVPVVNDILFSIVKNESEIFICGYGDAKMVNENIINSKNVSAVSKKQNVYFNGIEKLKKIEDVFKN